MNVTFLAAVIAGALSFFSPCVLPLVPAYLSMVTGLSVEELSQPARERRMLVLRSTLLFLGGFTLVFVALGASASVIGTFLTQYRRPFEIVMGFAVIGMSLFVMGVIRPRALQTERRFRVAAALGGWGAPVMGAAFAFGWTPCIGPLLGGVLTLAASTASVGKGVLLLFGYSLGLGIPFLASGMALSEMTGVFAWVKRHFRAIELASGALLFVFGVLLVTGSMTLLSGWIQQFMTWIGLERLTRI